LFSMAIAMTSDTNQVGGTLIGFFGNALNFL
jgi:hypothetical protein